MSLKIAELSNLEQRIDNDQGFHNTLEKDLKSNKIAFPSIFFEDVEENSSIKSNDS